MSLTRQTLLLLFHLVCAFSFSQSKHIDSLKTILNSTNQDTSKCRILNVLIEEVDDDAWPLFNEELLSLASKHLSVKDTGGKDFKIYLHYTSIALVNKAVLASDKGEDNLALQFYLKGLSMLKRAGDEYGSADVMSDIAQIYFNQGKIDLALDLYLSCLKIKEKYNDKAGMARALNNLAFIHTSQKNIESAIENNLLSLKIRREIKDKAAIAVSLNNLASIYQNHGDPAFNGPPKEKRTAGIEKAFLCLQEAIKLNEEVRDTSSFALGLNNIGVVYELKGDMKNALACYLRSSELLTGAADRLELSGSLLNIGYFYMKQKNYTKAIEFGLKSLKIGEELAYPSVIKSASRHLYKVYSQIGNYELAVENFERYTQMKDSLNNENTRKASIRSQLKYEFEKQAAADSVAHVKESEIKNAESLKQKAELKAKKNQLYVLFGGLALVLIFAGFMYNRFNLTKKQKEVIEKQKEIVESQKQLVEIKQKEILDSIHYARRIQLALLPSELMLRKILERLNRF